MSEAGKGFIDVGYMDRLSYLESPVHRLDPRSKLLVSFLYIIIVLSYDKYQVSALVPFAVFPVMMMNAGGIPAGIIIRRLALAAPFALLVGIFNPALDRETAMVIGPAAVSGGWISFMSIFLRFILTVSAALVLLSVTGIFAVCKAMEKFGVPVIFTTQLLFLYRYIFVLIDEGLRMARARTVRSFGNKGMGIGSYSQMAGSLLARSLDRAQRLHAAMRCRGFSGQIRSLHELKWKLRDTLFLACWSGTLIFLRMIDITEIIGLFIMESIR